MTTRKQMYAHLAAQRERLAEESKRSGLEAQRRDRVAREGRLRQSQQDAHDKNHTSKRIEKDCIHCQELLKEQQAANRAEVDHLVR